ncbi:MAG: DUF3786 domain-containing protein [Lachnospiraceae bacterium]|nr:DUF3786 domain-containing protein [Lachnospiraceae bacterium]
MEILYDKDNKERVPFEHYLEEYQKADPSEICSRTGVLWMAGTSECAVRFLGKSYAVGYPDFSVRMTQGDGTSWPLMDMNAAKILVIRFLLEGCNARSTGKFLTYREVPWGEVYYRQFSGRCLSRLAYSYGSRLDVYRSAMEKLGAKQIKAGDAGYEVEVFDGFLIRFQIWEGDEEFPPSAQILFSDNFAAAFHAEDLVVACDVVISVLKTQN